MFSDLNLVAIILSVAASEGLGFLMHRLKGLTVLANLATAVVLAYILSNFGSGLVADALQMAFWLWAGFMAPVQLTSSLFTGKPFNLPQLLIDTGYQLASVLVMAVILTLWI